MSIAILYVWVVYKHKQDHQRRCRRRRRRQSHDIQHLEYCCAEDIPNDDKIQGIKCTREKEKEIMRTHLENTPHRRCIRTQACTYCNYSQLKM